MLIFNVTKENIVECINQIAGFGVYCFKSNSEYLYIGKSVNLNIRLHKHKHRIIMLIEEYGMTELIIYRCEPHRMDDLEVNAIKWHRPCFNEVYNRDMVEVKIIVPSFLGNNYKKLVLSRPGFDSMIYGVEGLTHVVKKYA